MTRLARYFTIRVAMFKKMRTSIQHYREEAATLAPQAYAVILSAQSSEKQTRRMRRTAQTDPELAVALFLLDLERSNGMTAADYNAMIDQAREMARDEGVPEDELEGFLTFYYQQLLAQQGI